jgi:hypothetical protein
MATAFGLGERLPGGDDALELIVEIGDPFRRLIRRGRHRDGFVRYRSIEIQGALPKCRQINNGLHGRARLAHGLGYAVKVTVSDAAVFISAPAASLSQNGGVTIPQNNHGSLNQPGIFRVTLFIKVQTVFECRIRDALDAIVNR